MKITEILAARSQESHPLIQVILGPRQVGKTTEAKALFDSWKGSKVFVSADSPVHQSSEFIEASWYRARALCEPCLLIIDEVQKVSNWSSVIKELFDEDRGKKDLRVFLLGSASLSLQSGLSESLAGRYEVIRATHWNSKTMEEEFKWDVEKFLRFGGYPGAVRFINDIKRWQRYILDSIIEPVLSRDIGLLVNISKPALLRQVFTIAMEYPAQEVSYQKIVGQLQEKGSPQTVKHYLNILEGGFLLKQIFRYSKRPLSTHTSSPKIIPLAPSLMHAFSHPERISIDPAWRGRVFEALIGAELLKREYEVYFWKDKKHEVDYVVKVNNQIFAIEVKSGMPRKLSGMSAFLKQYPSATPVLITPENFQDLELV